MNNILERLRTHQPSVLLVEDNQVNQTLMSDLLENLGCKVTLAGDGQTALHHVNHHYDQLQLIFMDISLPDIDGVTITKIIRTQEQKEARPHPVPIIAITGHLLETEKERCLEAGMNAFTIKPVDHEEIQKLIHQLLFPHIKL